MSHLLRTRNIYWDPDNAAVQAALKLSPDDMSREQLILMVRELDRRTIQLWDKVIFENSQRDQSVDIPT